MFRIKKRRSDQFPVRGSKTATESPCDSIQAHLAFGALAIVWGITHYPRVEMPYLSAIYALSLLSG
jgi:hypothetical protein